MELINDLCGAGRDRFVSFVLKLHWSYAAVQKEPYLQLLIDCIQNVEERGHAAQHPGVFSTGSLGLLQNQPHSFRQSRPASRLKKACLHDAMFLEWSSYVTDE